MRRFAVTACTILALCTSWSLADDPKPPSAEPSSSTVLPGIVPTPDGRAIDTAPWNPGVLQANEFPYPKPIQIPTEYYGPPGDFWLRGEYYLWHLKSERLPPLVTSGGATLFGGEQELNSFSGARFTGGVWFDNCYTIGFEGSYFFLAEQTIKYDAVSSSSPALARPFVDALTGTSAAAIVASPGVASGFVSVRAPTEFQGAEANLIWNAHRSRSFSFDLIAGFRYLALQEELAVGTSSTALTGANTVTVDQFETANHFYGGQIGFRAEYRWHKLVFDFTEKLALGADTADVHILGSTTVSTPGGIVTRTAAGLLAQPSNIGQHHADTFAVVNEAGFQVGWQFCDYVQTFVGYQVLYINRVTRPENTVDLGVNLSQTTARPAFTPQHTDFWAHGINAGLEIRY
ncbi:MAG: BBP7 family outer membrane beta-barrel protein [Gemmataceae bacterium]|nr:BBP7 family outer membrane beta-barrel protein [Gemmataceae bacterium]